MFINPRSKRKPLFFLAFLAVPFVFVVIALGAFTRLSDAGLGCPDWPTCYGHILWPNEMHEINAANMNYSETPVETNKTWPEQVHRIFASSLGVISIIVFALSLRLSRDRQLNIILCTLITVLVSALVAKIIMFSRAEITATAMHDSYDIALACIVAVCFLSFALIGWKKGISEQPVKLPAFIVGFVILQGLFGMWTVTLKVWPQIVTAHLLGGFIMAGLFWLLTLRLNNKHWQLSAEIINEIEKLKPLIVTGFIFLVAQIALGGWTTSNYAAVACPDLPTCQGKFWPEMDFKDGFNIGQDIGPSYLGGNLDNEARVAIHMAHRIGALLTTIVLFSIALLLTYLPNREVKVMGVSLFVALFLQVCLGLSNIIFHFPLFIAVAHNAGGAVLLLTMITLMHRIFTVGKV